MQRERFRSLPIICLFGKAVIAGKRRVVPQFRHSAELKVNDALTLGSRLKPVCHSECTWACDPSKGMKITTVVAPAKAGAHRWSGRRWIPAFAGMTHRARFSGERSAGSRLDRWFRGNSAQSEIPRFARNDISWFQGGAGDIGDFMKDASRPYSAIDSSKSFLPISVFIEGSNPDYAFFLLQSSLSS